MKLIYCDLFHSLIYGTKEQHNKLHRDTDLAETETGAVQLRIEHLKSEIKHLQDRVDRLSAMSPGQFQRWAIKDNGCMEALK